MVLTGGNERRCWRGVWGSFQGDTNVLECTEVVCTQPSEHIKTQRLDTLTFFIVVCVCLSIPNNVPWVGIWRLEDSLQLIYSFLTM